MPKQDRSDKWFVRVTGPHSHLRSKLNEMKGWIDLEYMIIGYHTGGKTKKEHIHIALKLSSTPQQQTLNARIKKLFEVKGSDYSSKEWDGSDRALSYLYHDEKGSVEYFKIDISADRLNEIKRVSEVYSDIVKVAKEKASTRIPDRVTEMLKSHENPTPRVIVKTILEGVHRGEWYPPGVMMERYVQEIYIRLKGMEAVEALTDYYIDRFRY